jgi:ABC-type glycerol-3-phosphate transport system permease component
MMMQPLTHTLARIIWIAKNNLQDVRKELEDAASLD